MNSIIVGIIIDILGKLPDAAKDIEDVIKQAESPEDGKTKAKAIINDLVKLLSTFGGAL